MLYLPFLLILLGPSVEQVIGLSSRDSYIQIMLQWPCFGYKVGPCTLHGSLRVWMTL